MTTHTDTPTARISLVRTTAHGTVSVVRAQEPGELPVWTIHLRGEAPVYVALSLRDADRVADHWTRVMLDNMNTRTGGAR